MVYSNDVADFAVDITAIYIFYLQSAGFPILEIQRAQEIFQNVFFNGTRHCALFFGQNLLSNIA